MKEVRDDKYLDKLALEHEIIRYLKNKGIEFKFIEYEKGEILIKMDEVTSIFQFVVRGNIEIYGVKKDGSIYPVRYVNEFTALGDIEFCNECSSQFFVEAKNKVLCLAISLKKYREFLMNDNYFLRFLLKSISEKMTAVSNTNSKYNTFEEKLIYYMKEECKDNMITSVENTRFQLSCSRRQIQRILKKLVDENKIIKINKGCYKLNII